MDPVRLFLRSHSFRPSALLPRPPADKSSAVPRRQRRHSWTSAAARPSRRRRRHSAPNLPRRLPSKRTVRPSSKSVPSVKTTATYAFLTAASIRKYWVVHHFSQPNRSLHCASLLLLILRSFILAFPIDLSTTKRGIPQDLQGSAVGRTIDRR